MDVVPTVGDFVAEKHGGLTVWTPNGINLKHEYFSPQDKRAQQIHDEIVSAKAEVRATACWLCNGTPSTWVREIHFDLKHPDAPVQRAFVDTSDYSGPVPGFCVTCLSTGPVRLAELVANERPEIQWGLRPLRWFVIFTDGTRVGGPFDALDLGLYAQTPTFNDTHTHSNQ